MKKSNKILLITFLFLFILLSFPQWVLYQQFKKGGLHSVNEDRHGLVRSVMKAPRYLSIRGVRVASIILSDTFAIEYSTIDKNENLGNLFNTNSYTNGVEAETHPVPRYYRAGDTLVINGLDTIKLKDAQGLPLESKANWVKVYCRNLELIRLEVQKAYLQGDSLSVASTSRIELVNTSLEVGDAYPLHNRFGRYYMNSDGGPTTDRSLIIYNDKPLYYDSLHISLHNSILNLNPYCHINKLGLQFTSDNSSFVDGAAIIDELHTNCYDLNSLNFTGRNLAQYLKTAGK